MPVKKKTNNRVSKRNGAPERRQRKGVCSMCGAHTTVSHVEEFDNQLLCAACSEDTALLSQYLQSGRNPDTGLEDDLFDDEQLL